MRHGPCISGPTGVNQGYRAVGKHGEFETKGRLEGSPPAANRPRSERSAAQARVEPRPDHGRTREPIETRDATSISVVVVDQNQLLLRGIASVLSAESDIRLQAHAMDGVEALGMIRELRPDVALLGLHLPSMDALAVLEALRAEASVTRTVILAHHINEEEFLRATRLDARGIILLSMPPALLVRCVRLVHAGEEFFDKHTLLRTFGKLVRELTAQQQVSGVLTAREHAVMGLAVNGMSNKDVARKLSITEGTVKAHLHRAYTKLGVSGRIGLFHYAKEHGLI